jgi:hypothetical protein
MEGINEPPLGFPRFTLDRRVRAELIASSLRRGDRVLDSAFDEIYPRAVRSASPVHWTPLRVCARVVELLGLAPGQRLLDIGAGAGKFCIVAAAMSRASVRGVEREAYLAGVAREAARRFGIDIEVVEGTFDPEDASNLLVDAVYLFNPFIETLFLPGVGELASRDARRALADIEAAEALLAALRVGTRVVTFFGFGGEMPATFELRAREAWEGGDLELWEKRRPSMHGSSAPSIGTVACRAARRALSVE